MKLGVWIYGLATLVTGLIDIVWGGFETSHQPIQALGKQVAGAHVLAYIVGALLVVAGMAILWRSTARIGAALSAAIYLIFALLWVPRFYVITHVLGFKIGAIVFVLGGIAAQILLIAPAAFVFAGLETSDPVWRRRASTIGRWMLGVPPIFFGLGHLLNHSAYVRFVPPWVPFKSVWVVLTGIAFLLAGCAIVSGIRSMLAARLLALMLLLFEASVEIPPVFARPHSQIAWGGALYNVTAIAACWIFAELILSHRKAERKVVDVSGQLAASHPDSLIA
jgi:uncharacterized membrane protein